MGGAPAVAVANTSATAQHAWTTAWHGHARRRLAGVTGAHLPPPLHSVACPRRYADTCAARLPSPSPTPVFRNPAGGQVSAALQLQLSAPRPHAPQQLLPAAPASSRGGAGGGGHMCQQRPPHALHWAKRIGVAAGARQRGG